MDAESLYETCLSVLENTNLEEEDKTDRLEEIVKKETALTGKPLEDRVLDILWRYRNAATPSTSPSARHTVVRRNSPAPWQISRSGTPSASSPRSLAASPVPQANTLGIRPALFRMKSSYTTSPFNSPKPSPRMAHAVPSMARTASSNNVFDFGDTSGVPSPFDDYNYEPDWQRSDDCISVTSSAYGGDTSSGADWLSSQMIEMSPYDILRSVLREERTDEDIERVLEANGYDLSAAIASLMEGQNTEPNQANSQVEQDRTYLVGKMMAPTSRPTTPAGQARSPVICRYWLSTGQCLRADCRFSHDLSTHICKYWLAGNCLASDSCIFSHDPSALMGTLSLGESSTIGAPPMDIPQVNFQDYSTFPSLSGASGQGQSPGMESSLRQLYAHNDNVAPPPGFTTRPGLAPEFIPSRPQSRLTSLHNTHGSRANLANVDDGEAFPTLGSAALRGSGRKHHGKRGHGHSHRDSISSSMAEMVRMTSGPSPQQSPRRSLRRPGSYTGTRENSSTAQAIPAPEHIPWLETGERANKAYLKARQEAIRHGGARNKFLQSAAQAWNRNDVRAAKALSLRGQSENDLMREAHRTAARHLYEERQHNYFAGEEVYLDLHGLHPAEAVSYLASALTTQRSTSALHRDTSSYLYAIVGTGHHSKNGRDKVGKAVRVYLNECRYAFREFSVPGDRNGSGGILGIDIATGDINGSAAVRAEAEAGGPGEERSGSPPAKMQHGKVRILKAEEARGIGIQT